MGLDYFYDSEQMVIKAEMVGKFDLKRYTAIMKEIVCGRIFPPTTATIWDMRTFDFEYFNVEVAKSLSDARSCFPERKGAIISYVVSQPVGYGMMRMFTFMTDTVESSEVFYDYQEAFKWTVETDRKKNEIQRFSMTIKRN